MPKNSAVAEITLQTAEISRESEGIAEACLALFAEDLALIGGGQATVNTI